VPIAGNSAIGQAALAAAAGQVAGRVNGVNPVLSVKAVGVLQPDQMADGVIYCSVIEIDKTRSCVGRRNEEWGMKHGKHQQENHKPVGTSYTQDGSVAIKPSHQHAAPAGKCCYHRSKHFFQPPFLPHIFYLHDKTSAVTAIIPSSILRQKPAIEVTAGFQNAMNFCPPYDGTATRCRAGVLLTFGIPEVAISAGYQ
jgi:hypothetical protein